MKSLSLGSSFQKKLMGAFAAVGVAPLLVCVLLILNVFRLTLSGSAETNANNQLSALASGLGDRLAACGEVLEDLGRDKTVALALDSGESRGATQVYSTLYATAAPLLRSADFTLYDSGGVLRYTTGGGSLGETLPVNWGVLFAAREGESTVCRAVTQYDMEPRGRILLARVIPGQDAPAGYAVAELEADHLEELFAGKYTSDSQVLLLDPFWDQVYATPGFQDEGLVPRLRACLLEGRNLSEAGTGESYYILREEQSGFYVLLRQEAPMSAWMTRSFYLAAGVSLLLCLVLCLYASMVLSRQIVRPIRSLNSAMAAVEEGDLDARVEVRGTDEISQLSGRFNRMTQRLRTNLEESLHQQQELGNAQIRMMQAQLNPHFLYNTLDTLKWLGKINHVPEVGTISADLADILRGSISGGEFVPLREEVELLERYVEIQKLRFPGKFEYEVRIDPALLDTPVPKLMLQPLVENAIIHGFEDGSHGHILVTAIQRGEERILTVEDDGCGMSSESKERLQARREPESGRHFGLYNVDAILRLHYGPDRGLTFPPPAGGKGTCIRVILPMESRKEGSEP